MNKPQGPIKPVANIKASWRLLSRIDTIRGFSDSSGEQITRHHRPSAGAGGPFISSLSNFQLTFSAYFYSKNLEKPCFTLFQILFRYWKAPSSAQDLYRCMQMLGLYTDHAYKYYLNK